MRIACFVLALAACDGGSVDPGALIHVTTQSQVGVLLDEYPEGVRDRIAGELLAAPDSFWIERAKWQLRLTYVRLVYRKYYFDEAEWDAHDALPLPPEPQWNITLAGAPTRTTIDGHDLVVVSYTLDSMLVTDLESPGISEPMLAEVGGVWDEEFMFPVDPTLLFQRTGYACLSEDQFPPESVDAEDAFRFYDDTCEAESGEPVCHYSEPLPDESCADALARTVGRVQASLHYERVAWDEATADEWRYGEVTTPDAPDLEVLTTGEGLNDHRVIYKYFPDGHCALVENCVGGGGWRRLLIFDSHDHNVGGQPIVIGDVDYYADGSIGSELIEHGAYELSACHEHYHFEYYGNFSFGTGTDQRIQKNGFCLESTDRLSNHESAPLWAGYDCEYQGVQTGWGDLYGSSLTCNWVDVTEVDTSSGPVTDLLTFHSNPDGFICEGTLVVDENGEQVWEPTEYTTDDGQPVDRPACMQAPGTEENDIGSVEVTIPERGGFMTQPCDPLRAHDLGPLRNCGFEMQTAMPSCTAGETVTLTCSGGDAARPQVVRICETSRALATGVDCAFNDALANAVIETDATITFTCPAMRDATEIGGQYAIYTAPAWGPDGAVAITCAP